MTKLKAVKKGNASSGESSFLCNSSILWFNTIIDIKHGNSYRFLA